MKIVFILFYKFDPEITNTYRISNCNYSLVWIDDLQQLYSHNTYFIANEFFDAYPIHKFQVKVRFLCSIFLFLNNLKKTEKDWKEIMIDWNPITKQLQYVLSPRQTTMSQLYQNV